MADGTTFEIDLDVKQGALEPAAAAVARLSENLTASGAAAVAAASAVKDGETAYKQAEAAATKAATALERIGLAAEAQKGKLAAAADSGNIAKYNAALEKMNALTARQGEASAKASAATAALGAAASNLDHLKSAASSAADSEAKLVKELDAAKAAAKGAAGGTEDAGESAKGGSINMRALSGALGKLGGPLGSIGQTATGVGGALQKMSKTLGAAGPYVAAAVLAVAVAAAFAAAALAITKFGIESADAARTQSLLSAGIAGSVAGGQLLDAKFDDLANKVPIARDELAGMASELAKTGLKGQALSDALEVTATKAAKLKFGPNFSKQLLSLDSQSTRLKTNVSGLFSGLNIESLLEGLAKLVGLFDKNSESGKAIKVVFESLFQPIVDGLTAMVPKAVSAFLQIEILALKAMIAIKPFGEQIKIVGIAFGVLAALIVVAVTVVIGILLALAAIPVVVIAFFIKLGQNLAEVWDLISTGARAAYDGISGAFTDAMAFLQGLSLDTIGSDLIDGLINGITSAGPKVLGAITGIASGAVDAAKKALGIASPSKVFAEIGMHTAAGMQQGVDGGASDVQSSIGALVNPPDPSGGGAASATSSGAGGGNNFSIVVNAPGGDGESIATTVREALQDLFSQAGGAVPSA